VAPLVFLIPYSVRKTKNETGTVFSFFLVHAEWEKRSKMSYFVFPDTGRNEKNELTVHTRTLQRWVSLVINSRLQGLQKAIGLPLVKTTVSLLSHVHAKKIILAAAFAHSIELITSAAVQKIVNYRRWRWKLETPQRPGKLHAAGS